MSLEGDLLVDRRRLKRHLSAWQVATVLALVVAALAVLGRGPAGLLSAGPHLARLTISGTIGEDVDRERSIRALATDGAVAGLLVVIDSPGGTVGGGESLHNAIATVAAAKPVVAIMEGTAASAGYMIAVPAAWIVARNSTLTGSIGVLLQSPETSGLLAKLGVGVDVIASGPLKDQPNPFHPLSDEGRGVVRGLIDDLYGQFVDMVAKGRHMKPDAVRALADGRAYTGRQALALGLVDEIGGEAAAREWLANQRKIPTRMTVVDLDTKPHRGVFGALGSVAGDWLAQVTRGAAEAFAKTIVSQRLTLDVPVALWQGLGVGETAGSR